jgi:hypothetical protein
VADEALRVELRPHARSHFDGELDEIAGAIREVVPDAEIATRDPTTQPPGIGAPPAHEVLGVLLSFAGGYAFESLADGVISVARENWRQRRPKRTAGSRVVKFYGPKGEVLREITVSSDVSGTRDR